jgi:hypothetical protein
MRNGRDGIKILKIMVQTMVYRVKENKEIIMIK